MNEEPITDIELANWLWDNQYGRFDSPRIKLHSAQPYERSRLMQIAEKFLQEFAISKKEAP